MTENINKLFEQLQTALQAAEKRHRAVRDDASDNSNWDVHDKEVEIISNIIKWRRSLESLHSEVISSGNICDDDVSNYIQGTIESIHPQSEFISSMPESFNNESDDASHTHTEPIGQYVRRKMLDLCNAKFTFSDEQLANLQSNQWCYKVLNLPQQFFFETKKEIRYYWKRDIFTFNGKKFRLCSLWYNGLYRGRSQRECFDNWYDNLGAEIVSIPVRSDTDINISDDAKVGRYIREKLRELSASGFTFTDEQISQICDMNWSRQTFRYNRLLPFAKIVNPHNDISEQTKDELGYNRYWNEIFTFGSKDLLIISQWYDKDRINFDNWYAGLLREIPLVTKEVQFVSPETDTQITLDAYTPQDETVRLKPTKVTLFGNEYSVNAWNEMYTKVCEVLLLYKPYVMAAMDKDNDLNTDNNANFSYIQSDMKRNGKRLSNGLWIETGYNRNDIIRFCHKLLEKCGFSPDDIQIETVEVR